MQDTETRTDLQRLIDWLKTYTGYNILGNFQVDYTDQIPSNGAVFPQGLQEVERTETILGDVTLTNQYNFACTSPSKNLRRMMWRPRSTPIG